MKSTLKLFGILSIILGGLMVIGCFADTTTYAGWPVLMSGFILAHGIISYIASK